MSEPLPPGNLEELAKLLDDGLKTLEGFTGTPLPETVHEALEGDFLAAGGGVLETLLGRTSGAEMKEWGKRVMSLQRANALLREFESRLVQEYILSPASAIRIVLDGFLLVPKWIMKHLAELSLILAPLLAAAAEKLGDAVSINIQIETRERRIRQARRKLGHYYALSPGDYVYKPARAILETSASYARRLAAAPKWTAALIREQIKELDDEIERLRREIKDLTGLLKKANIYFDIAIEAVLAVIVWLSVERLLAMLKSAKEFAHQLRPARKLRDEIMEKIKSAAFPQAKVHRITIKKRSRRN